MYAPTGHVSAAAGLTGTVGWLSPERELDGFTATSDVWAVGVVAIWLLFGRHPWPCLVNPWRAGLEYEKHQPQFHKNLAKPLLTFDDITWMRWEKRLLAWSGIPMPSMSDIKCQDQPAGKC